MQEVEIRDGKISGQKSNPLVLHGYLAALARPESHAIPMGPFFYALILPSRISTSCMGISTLLSSPARYYIAWCVSMELRLLSVYASLVGGACWGARSAHSGSPAASGGVCVSIKGCGGMDGMRGAFRSRGCEGICNFIKFCCIGRRLLSQPG